MPQFNFPTWPQEGTPPAHKGSEIDAAIAAFKEKVWEDFSVEMRTTATHIQWKRDGEETWTDLIALSELEGPTGPAGTNGTDGADGQDAPEVQIQYSADGQGGWSSTFTEGDAFIRFSTDGGSNYSSARRFKGENVNLSATKGVIITDDTNAQRPEGFGSVEWHTPFEPTSGANGAEDGDTWIDTSE